MKRIEKFLSFKNGYNFFAADKSILMLINLSNRFFGVTAEVFMRFALIS